MQATLSLSTRASRQVDGALVQVRWMLGLLAWAVIALTTRSPLPSDFVLAWLTLLVIFNLMFMLLLRAKSLPRSLPVWGLVADIALFGALPYLAPSSSPLLFLFSVYPTIVTALRYGPAAGAVVAIALSLPYVSPALASFLPPSVGAIIPWSVQGDVTLVSAGLPVVVLFVVVLLVGFLAQREREAVVGDTAVELDQLRRGMAGANLLYKVTDELSQTLSYSRVLDAMLEAGISGMPTGRKEDGPPVAVALFFDSNSPERELRVVASRNIDRNDMRARLPGKTGVVAETLESADVVTFMDAGSDKELNRLSGLRRCRAGVCFPLQSGLDQYGVVVLATPAPRLATEGHLRLMRAFTNQAGVAFQNARLYQNLREERDHIIDAEANARAKLARDLHDGPTQSVASMAMRLDFINALLERDPDKAKQELIAARESAVHTGKELRELLFTLRPLTLETQGLSATLELWAKQLHDKEKLRLVVEPGDFGPELDQQLSGAIFAIVQEGVNNARKHAGGARIYVSVCRQNDNLVATIQDEGPGFDVESVEKDYDKRGSLGLVSMRERARLVGASFSVDSAPGRGTRVMVIVPLANRAT